MSEAINVAVEEAKNALVKEGKKWISKSVKSYFSEHERVYPSGNIFVIPARDYGNSRISANFNHQSWVPRGSQPVRVRFTVHGVSDTYRNAIRVKMKADKKAKTDRPRGPELIQHGQEFELEYGTSGDRAYYFVERGTITGAQLPSGAYFQLERIG